MNISDYLDKVRAKYDSGQATEHSYRGALEELFQSIDPALDIINEPKKTDAGMPDFLFQRGDVPVGWCEAKDVDKDVIALKGYSIEQRKRYEKAFPNLIYTNGVDFEFIRDGEQVHFVSIADFLMGLQPKPDKFDELERQLQNFAAQQDVTIRSAQKLAELMAAKAAIIKDEIGIALSDDPGLRSNLAGQFKSFKADLLPNLTTGEFADIYAETITYGMFAARLHDQSLDTFSRAEALELLPKSNPFLRDLFGYIAGPAIPDRLRYIVDDLAAVLRASDPFSLFEDFGKFTARNDPFVHFYETFLAEYNPKKRKSRGVWYTPEPVVDFIVRAVDDVLKTEFDLKDGLADTSKVSVKWDTGNDHVAGKLKGQPIIEDRQVHRVQILDPATGTGTFLAKAIQTISDRVKTRAPGKWSGYVEDELIPRIHGFELLMASYAMCHMKLDMMLRETGYVPSEKPPRFSVWLTNALEEGEREVRDLFFAPLANEARGANDVKRQTPIMCIIGNPPYSGHSSNFGEWIEALMADYKVSPELKRPAQAKWLSDDYVKFIRMSEHLIEKNGEGVLGFITNHSYLDNPTFMDMRHRLLNTFDKVYIFDLHGSTKRREMTPDGNADENVFDIQQGVAILVGVKLTGGSEEKIANTFHRDLWGSRKVKNTSLWETALDQDGWSKIEPRSPKFFLIPKNYELEKHYLESFALKDLFRPNGNPASGFVTTQDQFAISWSRTEAQKKVELLLNSDSEADARRHFRLCSQSQWNYDQAKKELAKNDWQDDVVETDYRLFDKRITVFNPHVSVHRRERLNFHFLQKSNIGLVTCRQSAVGSWEHVFLNSLAVDDSFLSNRTKERSYSFPLYLYPDEEAEQCDAFAPTGRTVNFDPVVYAAICEAAGLDDNAVRAEPVEAPLSHEAGPSTSSGRTEGDHFRTAAGDDRPTEIKVFDYIYGVLHSPDYREMYKEFLKIDFPRIPYPKDPDVFAHISEKGEALRRLHLMEDSAIGDTSYVFDGEGDDVVVSGFPKWETISPSSSEALLYLTYPTETASLYQ